jgi:hypothetical protein
MLLMIFSSSIYAQNPQKYSGVLLGKVIDKKTKKPLDYVNLTLKLHGTIIGQQLTDDDGLFTFKNLQTNQDYNLDLSIVGFPNLYVKNINLNNKDTLKLDLAMESGTELQEVMIIAKKDLVYCSGVKGSKITSKMAMNTPNIRGGRAEGTAYYIDGVRVTQGT